MTRWTGTVTALLVASLTACTSGTRTTRDPFAPPPARGGTAASGLRVEVISRQLQDVSLYVVGSANGRTSLGIVPARGQRSFRMAWDRRAGLQIEIQTRDGYRFLTPPHTVGPGETVYLVVEQELTASRLRS